MATQHLGAETNFRLGNKTGHISSAKRIVFVDMECVMLTAGIQRGERNQVLPVSGQLATLPRLIQANCIGEEVTINSLQQGCLNPAVLDVFLQTLTDSHCWVGENLRKCN